MEKLLSHFERKSPSQDKSPLTLSSARTSPFKGEVIVEFTCSCEAHTSLCFWVLPSDMKMTYFQILKEKTLLKRFSCSCRMNEHLQHRNPMNELCETYRLLHGRWMRTIFIHELWKIANERSSLRAIEFTILHNKWIKEVQVNQTWSYLFIL